MSEVKAGNSTAEMNSYPNLDVEEANIQEAIAQFYSFFGRMVQLRNDIELLALDDLTKNRILDQLEDIESELFYIVWCLVCECTCTCICILAVSVAECWCVVGVCVLMMHCVVFVDDEHVKLCAGVIRSLSLFLIVLVLVDP